MPIAKISSPPPLLSLITGQRPGLPRRLRTGRLRRRRLRNQVGVYMHACMPNVCADVAGLPPRRRPRRRRHAKDGVRLRCVCMCASARIGPRPGRERRTERETETRGDDGRGGRVRSHSGLWPRPEAPVATATSKQPLCARARKRGREPTVSTRNPGDRFQGLCVCVRARKHLCFCALRACHRMI